jgi:hypothetical protein
VFTSNGVYTVTVVGSLSGPHTMTVTKTVTITIYTVCTTGTLAYTAKSPLTVQYYNVGDPTLPHPTIPHTFGPFTPSTSGCPLTFTSSIVNKNGASVTLSMISLI